MISRGKVVELSKKIAHFGPNLWLGTGNATDTDELSEKFQTAFDPPLILGKSCCNYFSKYLFW